MTTTRNRRDRLYDRLDEATDNPFVLFAAIVIFLVLFGLALKIILNNVEPYLVLMGAQKVKPTGYFIVGWLVDVFNLLYMATGAMIMWALIQICQILWILIALDRKAHRAAIRASQEEASLQTKSEGREDAQIRRMKKRAVRVPFFFIAASGFIALGAFVAEFIINVRYFPVVKNIPAFLAGLTIGNLSAINFDNLLILLWNMFSTEIVVVALIIVGQWIWSHKNG